MQHRHKHRILRTTYLIAVLFFCFLLMQFLLRRSEQLLALIASFTFGLVLLVGYEFIIMRHLKDKQLVLNSMTQIYIGSIAISSAVILLLSAAIFRIPLESALYIMPAVVIVLLLATIRNFDKVLDKRLA